MAFDWNFRGGPTRTDVMTPEYMLGEEQRRAMQGYRPRTIVPPVAPDGYSVPYGTPADPNMYPTMLGGEGGRIRGAGDRNTINRANYGLGSVDGEYEELIALREEYQRNKARIAVLEKQIEAAKSAWKTGSEARMDALDRQLAINRAQAGDIANAYGHLGRIDARKLQQMQNGKADNTKLASVIEQLENAYIMQGSETNATAQAAWEPKINRLKKEYKELTGTDYVGNLIKPNSRNLGSGDTAKDLIEVKNKLTNLKAKRKDQRLSEADIPGLISDIANLPNGDEKNALMEEVGKAMYDSAEKADKNAGAYTAKVRKAVAAFKNDANKRFTSEAKKALKKEGGKATVTRDGIDMEVKYVGVSPTTQKKKFEIYVGGKLKDSYEE